MAERDKKSVRDKKSGDVKPKREGSAPKAGRETEFVRPAREESVVRPTKDEVVFTPERAEPVSRPARETVTPAREEAARKPAREDAQIRIEREEAARPVREDAPTKPAREETPARAGREESVMSARDDISINPTRETTKATKDQAVRREEIMVAENRRFIEKFDQAIYEEKYSKPVKSVVVNQDPAPGEFVPAGTPINLSFTIKETLPIESFKDVDKVLVDKYQTVGAMMADLTKADDATAKDAYRVISGEETRDYTALTTGDKQKVDAYMRTRFGFEPNTSADKARKVYNDMKFMNDL